MTTLSVQVGERQRVFAADDFPLSVGGPRPHVPLPGQVDDEPLAYFGQDHGEIFVQPAKKAAGATVVTCNGIPLTASKWLENGDRIVIGPTVIKISTTAGNIHLRVEGEDEEQLTNGTPDTENDFHPAPGLTPVSPTPFSPRWHDRAPKRGINIRPRTIMVIAAFSFLLTAAWYVLTAHSVRVETDPPADNLKVSGGIAPGIGGLYLLRSGTYRVVAERPGYLSLDAAFEVGKGTPSVLRFVLEPLGGTVSIRSRPVSDASIRVDGSPVGTTPLENLPLSAGRHRVEIQAPLHLPYSTTFEIDAGNPPITIEADLVPNWAPVTVASSPPGAETRIDRVRVGTTPLTTRVEAGARTIDIRLAGHKPVSRSLQLAAGQAVDLGVITLKPEDGRLAVTSKPGGATVTIGSQYRGTTPLDLTVPPDSPLDVRVSLAGHATYRTEISVASGGRTEVRATLEMLTGEVVITSQPSGAELLIDGASRGQTEKTVELETRAHTIEIRLDGYVPYQTIITPEPGVTQAVRATLKPAGAAGLATTITSPQEVELVLVGPGRFTMGASRREPGRRANEVLRDVEITKPYYIGIREVTNQEFREFKSGHLSGAYGGHNLEIDHHPVVNVTWEDAARYCNWLSTKAGLPSVYVDRAGTLSPRSPLPNGYRMPTEAEWAWAARYAASSSPTKYAWGNALPVPRGAGNFGDASGQTALRAALPDYQDGFGATAPVGSFTGNKLGLFNLGGNVAEWVQDVYAFAPGARGVVEKDPLGPTSGAQHVIRGASWMDTAVTELRLTYRDHGDQPRPDLGFRLARSAE